MAAAKTNPVYADADNDIRAHQEFILHLLKQGKDTWNESRAFDSASKSGFSGVVFHEDLNLDGYVF